MGEKAQAAKGWGCWQPARPPGSFWAPRGSGPHSVVRPDTRKPREAGVILAVAPCGTVSGEQVQASPGEGRTNVTALVTAPLRTAPRRGDKLPIFALPFLFPITGLVPRVWIDPHLAPGPSTSRQPPPTRLRAPGAGEGEATEPAGGNAPSGRSSGVNGAAAPRSELGRRSRVRRSPAEPAA